MITYVSKRLFPLILITTLVFLLTGCSEDSDEFTKSIIQIEKEGAGTVTKSPDKDAYKIGEKVTLTATPAKNYKFAGWQTADSSDTNKTITLTVQAPIIKVKAIFEKDENASDDDSDNSSGDEESNSGEYQLIVNCESTNHSVLGNEVGEITIRDVENEGITYYSGDNIPAGTKVQIYAEPNGRYDNYYFNYWESEDNTINNNNKFRNPLSITMDSNKELTVVFSNEFTVSATANRAGIIKVKGGEILFSTEVEKEGRFSYGKEITLIATPPADYGIAYWEVNGQRFNDSDNMNLDQTEISIKIDGNKDVKVIFSPNVYEGDYDQDEGTIWGAIREEINKKKGPITEANLKELLYINATGYDISDLSESSELTGEKYTSYLINLETLILDGSEIGDHPVDADMLETISEINSLRQLEISDIIVNDNGDDDYTSDDLGYDHTDFAVIDAFSKFDKLNNLEVLKLNHNGITDINFIQNLTKLKSLWLLNNRLKDITPLENLKDNLEEVYLTGNKYIRIGTDELPSSGDEHLDDLMIENYHVLNKLSSVYTEEWPEVIVDIEGDGKLNISPTNNENYFFPGRDIFIIPTPLARVGEGDVLTGLSIDGNPIKIQETDNTVDDNSVQALLNSEGRVIKGAIISDDDIIYATYYTNPDNGQTHNIIGKIVVIDCKSDIDISATFEE